MIRRAQLFWLLGGSLGVWDSSSWMCQTLLAIGLCQKRQRPVCRQIFGTFAGCCLRSDVPFPNPPFQIGDWSIHWLQQIPPKQVGSEHSTSASGPGLCLFSPSLPKQRLPQVVVSFVEGYLEDRDLVEFSSLHNLKHNLVVMVGIAIRSPYCLPDVLQRGCISF